jgi:gentisate 1,2-dioxygenase
MLNKSNQLLEEFSLRIRNFSLSPLWERTNRLAPGTNCIPFAWRFSEMLPLLLTASEVIEKKRADRRVLVMENPSLRGSSYISSSLFAGLQIIMPGEIAPSHRHSPNALRFLMKGKGAYTSISGEKIEMNPGDFIVTKNWDWHDHGNEGDEPVIWMDGLDTPLTSIFGSHFRENYSEDIFPLNNNVSNNESKFGLNLLPIDVQNKTVTNDDSLLIYSYVNAKKALLNIFKTQINSHDPVFGFKLKYSNPINGLSPFKTMSVFIQLLPPKFIGKNYRSTENIVLNIADGECIVHTEEENFYLKKYDIMVIPSWTTFSFSSQSESVIFSFSDKTAQESLGFWREEYLN